MWQEGAIIRDLTEEGKQMQVVTHDSYAPHQLVTLKQITGEDVEFQLYKVTDLEVVLHDAKKRIEQLQNVLSQSNSQLGKIIDNLTEDEFYNQHVSKEEVLETLCNILDHEPKKEISFTATFTVSGRYDIPMDEVEDFDLEAFLSDTISIDAYNGDVIIDDFSVESAEEN